MRKEKTEFSWFLAETALRHHYEKRHSAHFHLEEMRQNCLEFMTYPNIYRVYAKLLKMELNELAVVAAIRTLTMEKQCYLYLKYKKKKSNVAISLALNVSVAQLNLWHQYIVAQTARFMLYTLQTEDIFYPERIKQMVWLLDCASTYFAKFDPEGRIITKDWLSALTARYEQYRTLMAYLEELMEKKSKTLHECIVATRLTHPYENAGEIAKSCNVVDSVVSRHLHQFGEDMTKYLN